MKSIINMPYLRAKKINHSEFKTKRMTDDQSKLLVSILLSQREKKDLNHIVQNEYELSELLKTIWEDLDFFFFQLAIQKRIDVMELPIRFTFGAMMVIHTFADRIGSAILLLVDSLECFVKEENDSLNPAIVTIDDLISMYPYGFYDFDNLEFQNWIDSYLKIKYEYKDGRRIMINLDTRVKWAHVYE